MARRVKRKVGLTREALDGIEVRDEAQSTIVLQVFQEGVKPFQGEVETKVRIN